MRITVFKESKLESRIAIIPEIVKQYTQLGITVQIESGLGHHLYPDQAFKSAGAIVSNNRTTLSVTDVLLQVKPPTADIIQILSKNVTLVSFLDPFNNSDSLRLLANSQVNTIGIEFMPRSTIAQKMDGLSSQANLAGYVAVILAAERLDQVLPMMMTPAGTISPAKVFVIGAGVAGLQAIATAKRLGARVEAFDTRPVVEEQVKSLGAYFLKLELGDTGQTTDGYAKKLTEDQLKKQQELMLKACSEADIVITTAQVFGHRAPTIITKEMVSKMKSGSIVVDLAVETGGNVEGIVLDQEIITDNGVKLIGVANLPGHVARHASQVYASNIFSFIKEFYSSETQQLNLDLGHEIIKSALTIHNGKIVQPLLQEKLTGVNTHG